jgi:hypothetical protein
MLCAPSSGEPGLFFNQSNWRFTTDKARIKLKHLYPSVDA